jgi:predicted small lipoprotein YifL
MLSKFFFIKGFSLILMMSIVSCGQQGDLYLPEDSSKEQTQSTALKSPSLIPAEQIIINE